MTFATRLSAVCLALTGLLSETAFMSPALADACASPVVATGRAANPMNYDPPKHYDVEKMARARTLSAWQAKVKSSCPGASSSWTRATARLLECEGYAGGRECQASAIPAR